MNDCYMYKKTH